MKLNTLKRYLFLYRRYLEQYVKSLMEYRGDYIAGLIGFCLNQLLGVTFITLIFSTIPQLQGWSFYQILFIYGYAQIPRGLDHIFTDNIWMLSWDIIAKGNFDRYLVRPISPFFQMIAERFQPDGFGELIIGIVLAAISASQLHMVFSVVSLFFLFIFILCGSLIYTSIKVTVASFSFWVKNAQSFLFTAYSVGDFAKYPIDIFGKGIQAVLVFILPFAFTAYYPAAWFLGRETLLVSLGGTVLALALIGSAAAAMWCAGVKNYESAGS